MTAAINQARDEGNIELLREIADDLDGFMLRQGWGALNLTEEVEIKALLKLYASLQLEILNLLEMLNQLHESPEHELLTLSQQKLQLIEEVAAQQRNAISDEIADTLPQLPHLFLKRHFGEQTVDARVELCLASRWLRIRGPDEKKKRQQYARAPCAPHVFSFQGISQLRPCFARPPAVPIVNSIPLAHCRELVNASFPPTRLVMLSRNLPHDWQEQRRLLGFAPA